MTDRHLADVECPAGCGGLICVEVTREGARGRSGTARCRDRVRVSGRRSPACYRPRAAAMRGTGGIAVAPARGLRRTGAVSSSGSAMIGVSRALWRVMQLRLDLTEGPAPAAALWELVGEPQRDEAMALLAALIAQTLVAQETGDE
jgi:hypothetical protein